MEQPLFELVPMPVLGKMTTEQRALLREAIRSRPDIQPQSGKTWAESFSVLRKQENGRPQSQLILWFDTKEGSTGVFQGPVAG